MTEMRPLPDPEVYEKELKYFPWGKLIKKVVEQVTNHAPRNGTMLDLMCGPGMLLGQIQKVRRDLLLTGIDFDSRYIRHAKQNFSEIQFLTADVRTWVPKEKVDVIVCTGALHHLSFEEQPKFIHRVSQWITPQGFVIIADPFIGNFESEFQRKQNVAKLGCAYLLVTLKRNPPDAIISAAIDILSNDLFGSEFKNSLKNLRRMFRKHFLSVSERFMWSPHKPCYGEVIFTLKKPKP